MGYSSFDGSEDGEYNDFGIVEISKIFATQEAIWNRTIDRL